MGRGGRSRHERLDAAQAAGDDGDRESLHEAEGSLEICIQLQTQHPPETIEEPAGPVVVRLRLEPWIADSSHRRVSLQHTGHRQSAFVLLPHPQRQRLEPPVKEKAGMRIEGAAKVH